MTGIAAADGSLNVTVVSGSSYTGVYAADGSINVIKAPGDTYVGTYHPCGAWYVTLVSSPTSPTPWRAADGSLNVYITLGLNANTLGGQPVTVVSGSLNPGPPPTNVPTYYIYGF